MLEGLRELGEEIGEISGCQELGVVIIPEPNGEPLPLPPNGEPFIPPPPPPPIHGITEWLKEFWPYPVLIACWVGTTIIFLNLAKKKK